MTKTSEISVLAPDNDFEALCCRWLAEKCGCHVPEFSMEWGGKPNLSKKILGDLKETVVLVELHDKALEDKLRRQGKTVKIIDHHMYGNSDGKSDDLRNSRSSIEQLLDFLNPTPEDLKSWFDKNPLGPAMLELIAANDKGHVASFASLAGKMLAKDFTAEKALTLLENIRGAELARRLGGAGASKDFQEMFDLVIANPFTPLSEKDFSALKVAGGAQTEATEHLKTIGIDEAYTAVTQQEASKANDNTKRSIRFLYDLQCQVKDNKTDKYKEDISSFLTVANIDHSHSKVIFDALVNWFADKLDNGDKNARLEILAQRREAIFIFSDHDKIRAVDYTGPAASQKKVMDLLTAMSDIENPKSELVLYAGGGGDSTFFGAIGKSFQSHDLLSGVADDLLNNMAGGRMPLLAWRTSFFQPFRCEKPNSGKKFRAGLKIEEGWNVLQRNDQAHEYFTSYIRDILLPEKTKDNNLFDKEEALFTLERNTVPDSLTLECPDDLTIKQKMEVPVTAVRMHFFYGDIFMLEVEVGDSLRNQETKDELIRLYDAPAWKQVLHNHTLEGCSTFAQLIEFNGRARFSYSTFKDENGGTGSGRRSIILKDFGAVDYARGSTKFGEGWVASLISTCANEIGLEGACKIPAEKSEEKQGKQEIEFIPLGDERMKVMSSAVLMGGNGATEDAKKQTEHLEARYGLVDPFDSGFSYGEEFARTEMLAARYSRYYEWGSIYSITSHSFTFSGFGPFSLNHIHHNHMANIYPRMFLLGQFYLAIMSNYNVKMTDYSKKHLENESGFRALRGDFSHFVNVLWFRRISWQVQGQEIYTQILDATGIKAEVSQFKEKLESSYDVEVLDEADRAKKQDLLLSMAGGGFALFSIANVPTWLNAFSGLYKELFGAILPDALGVLFLVLFVASTIYLIRKFIGLIPSRNRGFIDKIKAYKWFNYVLIVAALVIFGIAFWAFI